MRCYEWRWFLKLNRTMCFLMALAAATFATSARADELLTGDEKLACEAVLCLSSGKRPSECSPSLSRYFGINMKKLDDTLDARLDFLSLCPASNESSEMKSLVRAISRGAGRCDAATLNIILKVGVGTGGDAGDYEEHISDKLPSYCSLYWGHAYVDGVQMGVEYDYDHGKWVER